MRAIGRRFIQLVIVLLLVTMFTALLINLLPGDPVVTLVPFGSNEQRTQVREELHLDQPIYSRYWHWLTDFVQGDLGKYYAVSSGRPVSDDVKNALPLTLQLMLYAQLLALVLAIPLGIFTAYRAGSWFDKAANTTAFGLIAIPDFALALVLAYYVGVKLRWVPNTYVPAGASGHLKSFVLPAVSLAAGQLAVYMRLLRSDMIATLQEDFITMAKAKGMRPGRILWRHALRPSSLTLLTVAGLNVGTLIGGTLVLEVIFGIPGIGRLIGQAIIQRQYVALQSLVAIVALGYVAINFLVDILYAVLDPRIRHARALG